VTTLKGFSLTSGLVGFYTLLSEPNGFYLRAGFGDDNMGLGWMVWCALWFVETGYTRSGQSWVSFCCCHYFAFRAMLLTVFTMLFVGMGANYLFRIWRPAALAARVFGTNCLPAFVPRRFFSLVALYWASVNDPIARFGK